MDEVTSSFIRSDKIGEHLTCPICMDLYENPKVLVPCLHTLCEKCVYTLYNHSKQFACPQCRQQVDVPSSAPTTRKQQRKILLVPDYVTTVKMKSLLPHIAKIARNFYAIYMNSCIKRVKVSTKSIMVLLTFPETQTHTVTPVAEYKGTPRPKTSSVCSKHDNEQLKLFCESCDKPTCAFCILLEHKDHPYLFIHEALEKNMPLMRKMMLALEDNATLVEHTIADITAVDQLVNQQKQLIKYNIKRYAEELKKTIDSREKELLDQLDKLTDANSQTLSINHFIACLLDNRCRRLRTRRRSPACVVHLIFRRQRSKRTIRWRFYR